MTGQSCVYPLLVGFNPGEAAQAVHGQQFFQYEADQYGKQGHGGSQFLLLVCYVS